MQEIIKEYGSALITIVSVLALVTIIRLVIGTNASGPVGEAFSNLLQDFILTAGLGA